MARSATSVSVSATLAPPTAERAAVGQAFAHHVAEAGAPAAPGLLDAVAPAFRRIGRQPALGSPRDAHAVRLDGLRAWPLTWRMQVRTAARAGRVVVVGR